MIKVTFEFSEESIIANADPSVLLEKVEDQDGREATLSVATMLVCMHASKLLEEGRKEFYVTPDKLGEKTMSLYEKVAGVIIALAVFSETDKPVVVG